MNENLDANDYTEDASSQSDNMSEETSAQSDNTSDTGIEAELEKLQKEKRDLEEDLAKADDLLKVLSPIAGKIAEILKSYRDDDKALGYKQLRDRHEKWSNCFKDQYDLIRKGLGEEKAKKVEDLLAKYDKIVTDLAVRVRTQDIALKQGCRHVEIAHEEASEEFKKAQDFQKIADDALKSADENYKKLDADCSRSHEEMFLLVLLGQKILDDVAIVLPGKVEELIVKAFRKQSAAAEALSGCKKLREDKTAKLDLDTKMLAELKEDRETTLVDQAHSLS